MKTITNSIYAAFGVFAFICFTAPGTTQAVNPPPDGCYPNFTTAEGCDALNSLTSGVANTAVGWSSLSSNTEGSLNTATGAGALLVNRGDKNTAFGAAALLFNTTAEHNTAVGAAALLNNTTGGVNTATGAFALYSNTTGGANTAFGDSALSSNSTGSGNTAIGNTALGNNDNGDNNTAIGVAALFSITTGAGNIAVGNDALGNNITGFNNTALGFNAGTGVTTASNVICIGAFSGANVDDSCFIGNIYSNVQPIVGTDPDSVTITSTGRLGRGNVSSRRYKHDIKPMAKASEALYALKPVSFRYNKEYDATQILAFGLIAEEVAGVYPDLVGRNSKGEPESVRYEQINAMLLNEFLKEHKRVEALQATVARQQKAMETFTAQLKEQAAQIQKVSAQVELSRPSARTVLNDR